MPWDPDGLKGQMAGNTVTNGTGSLDKGNMLSRITITIKDITGINAIC